MSSGPAPVDTAAEERRRKRAAWPIRQFRLGGEPSEDLSATTTAEGRLAMMWPLAVDAFCVRGVSSAASPRAAWPVKVRRLGDPEAD